MPRSLRSNPGPGDEGRYLTSKLASVSDRGTRPPRHLHLSPTPRRQCLIQTRQSRAFCPGQPFDCTDGLRMSRRDSRDVRQFDRHGVGHVGDGRKSATVKSEALACGTGGEGGLRGVSRAVFVTCVKNFQAWVSSTTHAYRSPAE